MIRFFQRSLNPVFTKESGSRFFRRSPVLDSWILFFQRVDSGFFGRLCSGFSNWSEPDLLKGSDPGFPVGPEPDPVFS